MEAAIQKIDLKNIDKADWIPYRFDQIAKNISERVDPNNTDLEIYVGLEHLDPESIHIKRTGTRDDVNGQKLRCYPGDIIFGRRRAYQRKAALVTFDGFCSAHSLVLRANPKVIDPKLFPFFLHSDAFMHRAVDISVGSLSPTINWGTLKSQEFLLPPKDQQAQLAELLWAMDEVIERELEVFNKMNQLKSSSLNKVFQYSSSFDEDKNNDLKQTDIGWIPKSWEVVEQQEVAEFVNGRAYKKEEWEESGIPVIRLQNLTGSGAEYYYSNLELPDKNYCQKGDLLYMWSATFGAKIWEGERAIFHYHIWKIMCDESRLNKMFMYYNLEEITRRMMRQVSGSTMPHITKAGMEKLKIALPPLSYQLEVVDNLNKIITVLQNIESKVTSSNALQKSLINQIF